MHEFLPDIVIEIVVIEVGDELNFRAWWRSEEFEPLDHGVHELVQWTEEHGVGQRRYRHYMAALFDLLMTGQLVKVASLSIYMEQNICGYEMAQDYLAIMHQAQSVGAFVEAELFKAFVLGTLVSTDECMQAALMAAA